MMIRLSDKRVAIELREQGYSYNLIAEKLRVSKSTLSGWLAEVPYSPNEEVVKRIGKARAFAGKRKSEEKRKSIETATALALKDIGVLSKRDIFMLGIGLYIGEGAKSTTLIRFTNANPRIVVLAMRWFEEICGVSKNNFSLRLYLYPDNDPQACIAYWSRETKLPESQFSKIWVDRRVNKKMAKRGKLPYGTAHLSVNSKGNILLGAFLRRRIDGWMAYVLGEKQYADVV